MMYTTILFAAHHWSQNINSAILHCSVILIFFATSLLSGCSYLHHSNTPNNNTLNLQAPPTGCKGHIPIALHWGAGWHTSIVLPNRGLIAGHAFQDFPFIEVNWGDKGFYASGASQLSQILAAPKALLLPSSSVMYFVGIPRNAKAWCTLNDRPIDLTNTDQQLLLDKKPENIRVCSNIQYDYSDIFRYFDGIQIWVTTDDFDKLTYQINQAFATNQDGSVIDLGNGFLFDPAYSTSGRFYTSKEPYFGLTHTCNSWTAEVISNIDQMKSISNQNIYRSEALYQFLHEQTKNKNSCVKSFTVN